MRQAYKHALSIIIAVSCVSCYSMRVPILAGSGVAPISPPSTGRLKISIALDISYTWTVTSNNLQLTVINCPSGKYIVQARSRSGNTEDVLGFSWWESSGFKQATITISPFTNKHFTNDTYPVILIEHQ